MEKDSAVVDIIINPFKRLINSSKASGIVLFIAAAVALILANSPFEEAYHHFWENHISIGFNNHVLNKSLHHWINDGLMAVFFFSVGLELKAEIMVGDLRTPKQALLPILAAVGGMILPAGIYAIMNFDSIGSSGWGIPMATDIAFALGVLYLLGDRVPRQLKIFLAAIAIVDDLGAVLVIAFFYTSSIDFYSLLVAGIILAIMITGNKIGVRSTTFYTILGFGGLWLAFLMSGVHATIAAVLAAFTIPATTKYTGPLFRTKTRGLLEQYRETAATKNDMVSKRQLQILDKLRYTTKNTMPPLQRLEHAIHPFVTFIIMPLFALANAGVTLSGDLAEVFTSTITIGIMVGLLLGKIIGVGGVTYLAVKFKIAKLPENITMPQVFALSILASIGFTMSLFIANLAFKDPELLLQAKVGVLFISIIASIIGYFLVRKYSSATQFK